MSEGQPKPFQHLRTTLREYLTHWTIAGVVVTTTGFAPDHWVAYLLHRVPFGFREIIPSGIDYRLVVVCFGILMIGGDIVLRNRQRSRFQINEKRSANYESQVVAYAPPALRDKTSIAVLPFDNMSGDSSQTHVADGLTDDLITALSKYRWLRVIARHSCFAYKSQATDVRRAAKELEATYIVEGSVRRADNRLRVTAQLLDGATGKHIWAERYDRNLNDLFAVQDEITGMIVGRLESEVGIVERERVIQKPTQNLGAWDCYHIGLSEMYRFTRDSNAAAQRQFRRALELDPRFALAHARLAYCMILEMVYFDARPTSGAMDDALRLAQNAVALDANEAFCMMALGRVHIARREYEMGLTALKAALALNPSMSQAYCGVGDALAYSGRPVDAIPYFEEAIRLGPNDPWRWAFYSYGALALILEGRFEQATQWAREAILAPNSQYHARTHLAAALGHLGRTTEAAATLAELKSVKPTFSLALVREQLFYLNTEQIEFYLEGLRRAGLND